MRMPVSPGDRKVPEVVQRVNESLRSQSTRSTSAGLRLLGERAAEAQAVTVDPLEAADPLTGITTDSLDSWLVEAQAFSSEEAANVSVLGGLFSGRAERVEGGLIHEARRFVRIELDGEAPLEVGVAVRLSAATLKTKGGLELTLPNLAARAQLSMGESRVGISVVGFNGPLGSLLPAPKQLDVEAFGAYVEAFDRIQAFVFSTDGLEFIHPTVLSYET